MKPGTINRNDSLYAALKRQFRNAHVLFPGYASKRAEEFLRFSEGAQGKIER
jgi:hypothetical protein